MQWLCPARAPQPMLFPPIKAPLCCYNGLLVTTELCPNQVFLIAGPKAHPLKQQPHTLWPVFLVKTLPPKGPAVDLPPPFPLVQCRYPPYCPMKESEENLYATCACHATPDPSPTRLFCGVWFGADEAEDVRLVYKNSYCFYEPFLCPTMSLLQAGVRARMTRGLSSKETMLHVLDSHSCSMPKESDTWLHRLPKRYIIYQLEQYGSGFFNPLLFEVCKAAVAVWDYDPDNASHLAKQNISVQLARPGYHPLMELPTSIPSKIRRRRIPLSHSFDVLFLGNYTDRRKAVLDKIMALGMTVELVTPLDFGHFEYTPLWDVSDRIHTAKVVVNIHSSPRGVLETFRLYPLLSNGKAVVSESSEESGYKAEMDDAVVFCGIEDMPELCRRLCADERTRRRQEAKAYDFAKAHRFELSKKCIAAIQA